MRKDLTAKVAKLTAELEAKLKKCQAELLASDKQCKAVTQTKDAVTQELYLSKERVKSLEASGRITQYQLNFANSAFTLFKQNHKFEEGLSSKF